MTVLGIGTDLCECDRMAQLIDRHGALFLERIFTAEEIRYCGGHQLAAMHYAGRFAAKEAILKALGVGWAAGMTWRDLEVVNVGGGAPQVHIHGSAVAACQRRGIQGWLISISHTRQLAMATAIAMGSAAAANGGSWAGQQGSGPGPLPVS